MLRFDQYASEEEAYKDILLKALAGHEDEVMAIFLKEGPETLKKQLRLLRDDHWNTVFDYLVFERGLLKICVLHFRDFFQNLVIEKGPEAIRAVLGIEDKLYDTVFEQLFELIALCDGTLFAFVKKNQSTFLDLIKKGKGGYLRKKLCLEDGKYQNTWGKIVAILHENLGQQLIDENLLEKGIGSFVFLMNYWRTHQSL